MLCGSCGFEGNAQAMKAHRRLTHPKVLPLPPATLNTAKVCATCGAVVAAGAPYQRHIQHHADQAKLPRTLTTASKKAIFRRDRGICQLCGQPGADEIDHIKPWAEGGSDEPSNLRAVHHGCNPRGNVGRRSTAS